MQHHHRHWVTWMSISLLLLLHLVRIDPILAHPLPTISIQMARMQPLGTMVTIQGIVTVASGTFEPNDTGFAIQSKRHGIYIHTTLGEPYLLGELVRVTGTLENSFSGVLGIRPTEIERLGERPIPKAERLQTQAINETTEGHLVAVQGMMIGSIIDDTPYGWKFYLDDGSGPILIFVYAGTNLDWDTLHPGHYLAVQGFSGQFQDHYEINPRIASDIRRISSPNKP